MNENSYRIKVKSYIDGQLYSEFKINIYKTNCFIKKEGQCMIESERISISLFYFPQTALIQARLEFPKARVSEARARSGSGSAISPSFRACLCMKILKKNLHMNFHQIFEKLHFFNIQKAELKKKGSKIPNQIISNKKLFGSKNVWSESIFNAQINFYEHLKSVCACWLC